MSGIVGADQALLTIRVVGARVGGPIGTVKREAEVATPYGLSTRLRCPRNGKRTKVKPSLMCKHHWCLWRWEGSHGVSASPDTGQQEWRLLALRIAHVPRGSGRGLHVWDTFHVW